MQKVLLQNHCTACCGSTWFESSVKAILRHSHVCRVSLTPCSRRARKLLYQEILHLISLSRSYNSLLRYLFIIFIIKWSMDWYYQFTVTVGRAKIRRLWKLLVFAENSFRFMLESYMYSAFLLWWEFIITWKIFIIANTHCTFIFVWQCK